VAAGLSACQNDGMADGFVIEVALVGLLILLNGFFAAGEIALVTARPGRLQALADAGSRGARSALRLKADPDRFLATVQIGVTLVGTLASAVGGVAAIERLEPLVAALPATWAQRIAEPVAVGVVVFTIAYLSLVAGELVPKSLAVRNAEPLAAWIAPKIEALSRFSGPAVAALTASSRVCLRLFGQEVADYRPFHTLEDLRAIAAEAEQQGVVKGDLVSGAIEFHEREVREVLTPRPRIQGLALGASLAEALRLTIESGHSRFPVYAGSLDHVVGFAYARDVYEAALSEQPFDVAVLVRPALMVPERKPATELLAEMRRGGTPMALVIDEHGVFVGLVTIEDLIEVIVGEIRDEHKAPRELVRAIGAGVLDVDGSLAVHELSGDHGVELPESAGYVSVGGLVLERLGSMPRVGDTVEVPPYTLTVTEVDGRRIARVRIARAAAGVGAEAAGPPGRRL
jgi:putative hemolysin